MTAHLRLATPADAAAICDLGRRAFVARFGHLYRPEDLAAFLDKVYSEAPVLREVGDPGLRIAVMEDGGALVSFCKIALKSSLPAGHSNALCPMELKQLYTDPTRIGGGLGARLMEWALQMAEQAGADEIQLSVYSDNPEAQRFYARYGFAKIADIEFWVGDHCDAEFMFARKMTAHGDSFAASQQV